MFGFRAYQKACNVLKKDKWYFFLIAIGDKAGCLVGTIGIDNAAKLEFAFFGFYYFSLIGYNAYCPAIDAGITCDNGLSVAFFVFVKFGIIYQSVNNFFHIVGFGAQFGQNAINFFGVFSGFLGYNTIEACFLCIGYFAHSAADAVECIFVVEGFIVGNSADFAVCGGTAKCFIIYIFAYSGFY